MAVGMIWAMGLAVGVLAAAAGSAGADARGPQKTRPDGKPNRAYWMAKGSFGLMTHYLVVPAGATDEERTADFNRTVDAFDLDAYMAAFRQSGADWLIFTLGQTTGYLCSPNAAIDSLEAGHTSRRDLALEVARRVHALGKRFILYIPSEQNAEPVLQRLLRYDQPGHEQRYFDLLRVWSLRFGKLLNGWWFDSCGPHEDAYWQDWMTALRAGNPDTAVAFSGAEFCCGGPAEPVCKLEDYHAGEIHMLEEGRIRRDFLPPGGDVVVVDGRLRLRGQEARTYMPDGPFIEGVQWHGLLPLDLTFNPAVPNAFCRYPDRELFGFVEAAKGVGGAVTINVPLDIATGTIPGDTLAQIVRLSKRLRARPAPAVRPKAPGAHAG